MTENGTTRFEMDLTLFSGYTGPRTKTDKRFPNGKFILHIPAPEVEIWDEKITEQCRTFYKKTPQQLFSAGIVQHCYGERDWNNLMQGDADKLADVPDSTRIERIEAVLGPMNGENLADNATKFFEAAIAYEAKERTSQTAVVKAKAATLDRLAAELGLEVGADPLAAIREMKEMLAKKGKK